MSDRLSREEIDRLLNPDDKSEDWPEFEEIKDNILDFFTDMPIEIYEHLLAPANLEPDRLIQYLLDFPEKAPEKKENEHDCLNHCPNCGADGDAEEDVDWGHLEADCESAWQEGECKKCGCIFNEVYLYQFTEIKHDSPVPNPHPNPDE